MGLSKESNNFVRRAAIKHHAICFESKVPEAGFEPHNVPNPSLPKNPDGSMQTVRKYLNFFASLDGLIRKIEWYDSENKFPTRFLGIYLYIEDLSSGKTVILDLPLKSGYYDQFTKQMELIDYKRPVSIEVWHDKTDPKKPNRTAFKLMQDGAPVKWKYTRANPGDMPAPVQGLSGWDYSKQKAWLHEILTKQVIPHVDELNAKWTPDYHEICHPVGGSAPPTEAELQFTGGETDTAPRDLGTGPMTAAVPPTPQPLPAYDDDIPF